MISDMYVFRYPPLEVENWFKTNTDLQISLFRLEVVVDG